MNISNRKMAEKPIKIKEFRPFIILVKVDKEKNWLYYVNVGRKNVFVREEKLLIIYWISMKGDYYHGSKEGRNRS